MTIRKFGCIFHLKISLATLCVYHLATYPYVFDHDYYCRNRHHFVYLSASHPHINDHQPKQTDLNHASCHLEIHQCTACRQAILGSLCHAFYYLAIHLHTSFNLPIDMYLFLEFHSCETCPHR